MRFESKRRWSADRSCKKTTGRRDGKSATGKRKKGIQFREKTKKRGPSKE